jgi:NADH-quinone oxidoreductase subunit N
MLAASLAIFLLSLIGIPMTGGFFAKFYVFSAAVNSHLIWLTIIGVLNGGVGAYYYLRIIVAMYMRESRKPVPVTRIPFPLSLALIACLFATFYLGLFPGSLLRSVQKSAQHLVQTPRPDSALHGLPLDPGAGTAARSSATPPNFLAN